jgi:hypothetical protein
MYNSYLAQLNEMIQSAKRKLHDLKKKPNTSWTNYPRASLFDVNPTSQSSDTVDSKSRNYKGVEGRPFFGSGGEWGAKERISDSERGDERKRRKRAIGEGRLDEKDENDIGKDGTKRKEGEDE